MGWRSGVSLAPTRTTVDRPTDVRAAVQFPRGPRPHQESPCSSILPDASPLAGALDATGRVQDGELVEAVAIDIAVGMKAAVIDEKLQRKLCVASARTGLDNYQKS